MINTPKLIVEAGLAVSLAEARRLVAQGQLFVNDNRVIVRESTPGDWQLELKIGDKVRVGRREVPQDVVNKIIESK